jgi:phosphoglycolate phosphatase
MRSYAAAIFDVDGTLLDTTAGISAAVRETIAELGLREVDEERLRSFIGPPIQESFAREYGLDTAEAQAAAEIFRKHYKGAHLLEARPYPGILEALAKVRRGGTRIGIATYKRADYATLIVDHFGFGALCESVNGADNENRLRKQDIIRLTLSDMGLDDPSQAIYIGDTVSDAQSAESAGMDFMAVTYGFGFGPLTGLEGVPHIAAARDATEIAAFLSGAKNQ